MNNLTLCCIPVAKEYISKELTRYKRPFSIQKTCADLVHFFHSTKKTPKISLGHQAKMENRYPPIRQKRQGQQESKEVKKLSV